MKKLFQSTEENRECVIVIVQKNNMRETRIIGDKKLAEEYAKNKVRELLTFTDN